MKFQSQLKMTLLAGMVGMCTLVGGLTNAANAGQTSAKDLKNMAQEALKSPAKFKGAVQERGNTTRGAEHGRIHVSNYMSEMLTVGVVQNGKMYVLGIAPILGEIYIPAMPGNYSLVAYTTDENDNPILAWESPASVKSGETVIWQVKKENGINIAD